MGLDILIKKEEPFAEGVCESFVLNDKGQSVQCDNVGLYRYDNGLPVGYHCDECYRKMISECRK